MSDTMPPADPWAPVHHEDAPPEPEPTAERPIKVAAHIRAPRQTTPEPKAEKPPAAATLPLALSVAVPTDLMDGFQALIESQKALIAKIDALLGKIDALADARATEPGTQSSLPGLQ